MKPCKHLDYEPNYVNCELRQLDDFKPPVRYWFRPHAEQNQKCQFCKKRGRINSIFACYNEGEMSCKEVED